MSILFIIIGAFLLIRSAILILKLTITIKNQAGFFDLNLLINGDVDLTHNKSNTKSEIPLLYLYGIYFFLMFLGAFLVVINID